MRKECTFVPVPRIDRSTERLRMHRPFNDTPFQPAGTQGRNKIPSSPRAVSYTHLYMPAFKNEDGDGAMGLSYFAADSPICLTTACENPQEVFDTFFDWYLTSENGIVSTSVGLEGYSFEVVDGQVIADPEKGIGFHGQSFPPVDMDYEYPFQFDETYQFCLLYTSCLSDARESQADNSRRIWTGSETETPPAA